VIHLENTPVGCILTVRAQPGAKRSAIVGEHDGSLRIAVIAPPEKGKANQAIVELLAGTFGLSKSSVKLLSGQTSRQKKFLLEGVNLPRANEVLDKLIAGSS
jgi:uncharacterized protein